MRANLLHKGAETHLKEHSIIAVALVRNILTYSPAVSSKFIVYTLGTTFPFALTLVELLCGKEKRAEVAGPMVFPAGTFE